MFFTSDEINEVRIFRSRLVWVSEQKSHFPDHLRHELEIILKTTAKYRQQQQLSYDIDHSIKTIVRFLLSHDADLQLTDIFDDLELKKIGFQRLIHILGQYDS